MSENNKTVVVLGASPKPERYSNQAVVMLKDHGYEVIPVKSFRRQYSLSIYVQKP